MSITDDYLLTSIKDYHDVYQSATHALYIDTTDLDFVHRPEDYDRILSQITTLLGENHV